MPYGWWRLVLFCYVNEQRDIFFVIFRPHLFSATELIALVFFSEEQQVSKKSCPPTNTSSCRACTFPKKEQHDVHYFVKEQHLEIWTLWRLYGYNYFKE